MKRDDQKGRGMNTTRAEEIEFRGEIKYVEKRGSASGSARNAGEPAT